MTHLRRALSLVVLVTLSLGAGALAAAQVGELERLEAAADAAPRDAAAARAYGMALLRAGRHREAGRALDRAARLAPRGALEPLFDAARPAFDAGDHDAAQRACRALGRVSKTAVLAYVCDARADLVWNRSARAFEEIDAALAIEPGHFEALLALGDAHRLRGAVSEAESAYGRAATASPGSAEPHLGLGRLYLAASRPADAVRELRQALALDGTWPAVQYELGRALHAETAGSEEARRLLEQANAGRPDWVDALVALGEVRLAASLGTEAEASFRAAMERDDRSAAAHVGLGRALLLRGEAAAAEAPLRRALELVANDASAMLALGDVLARTEREEEAFETYRRATDLDPRNPEGLLRATRLALELRRDVLASAFLDRILARTPDHAAALALYGDVMSARSDRERARDYYTRALSGSGPVDRAHCETRLRELGR
jgi:tetratricopeptide (TPR) repeat protein